MSPCQYKLVRFPDVCSYMTLLKGIKIPFLYDRHSRMTPHLLILFALFIFDH